MTKFNILHVSGEKNLSGGEVQLLNLCKGLRAQGHNCFIACPKDSKLFLKSREKSFFVQKLPKRGVFGIILILELIKIIKSRNIDIVHLHSYSVYRPGSIAAKLAGAKGLVLTRRMDFNLPKNFINKIVFKKMVDKIIAVSEAVRKAVIAAGVEPSKIITIHDSVDLENFTLKSSAETLGVQEPKKPKLVGTVANLCKRKGIKFFLEAAAKVIEKEPSTKFIIVGDGPLKNKLKFYANNTLHLSKSVIFTGFKEDIRDTLKNIDIFVLPSLKEGLGVAILEAMAFCLPVIATKTGGIPESVVDGVTGLIVSVGDSKMLAEKIIYLLDNPKIAKKMGENGRKRVEEEFDNKRTVPRHEEVYAGIVRGFNSE